MVHQGTVVGFYADRRYELLYARNFESVMTGLAEANFLVYDQPSFFRLSPAEVDAVDEYIAGHFEVDGSFRDDYREVTVYRGRSVD